MSRKAHCTKAGQWIDQQNRLLVILCLALTLPASLRAQAGQLDKTFGNGGIFLGQNAGLASSAAAALTIQSDGKILIAGQFLASNGTGAALRRAPCFQRHVGQFFRPAGSGHRAPGPRRK